MKVTIVDFDPYPGHKVIAATLLQMDYTAIAKRSAHLLSAITSMSIYIIDDLPGISTYFYLNSYFILKLFSF